MQWSKQWGQLIMTQKRLRRNILSALQTTFYRFIKTVKEIFKGLALCGASGYGGNFRPETTFFSFVNYDFDFHTLIIVP